MKQKLKVIHIEHCSHSYFVSNDKNLDDVVRGSWGTQVAREVKKFYPNIEIECWFPEKIEKEKREFNYLNMKMRIFPTTFSPMYALDFSMQMINALKEEINKCKKENTRLIIHIHEYHNLHGLIIAGLFKKQKMIAQHHGGSWPLKHLKQTRKYLLFFPFFLIGQILEKRVLKNRDNYIKLFQEINSKFTCKFFLFGGKKDEILIQKVMSSVSNSVSLAKLDLEEIIPIIAACRFYIGNDSGPLHISANLGLKCLAIFCDSPPSAYGLWNSNIKIVVPAGKTIESTKHNTRGKHEISFDEMLKKSLELIN